ncbi:hypothetical protein PQX77_017176 [Marasmius sp. AFHP31]|nr:hypothetical protein PQX77_017176 [Marasmius sp. AFHP31]
MKLGDPIEPPPPPPPLPVDNIQVDPNDCHQLADAPFNPVPEPPVPNFPPPTYQDAVNTTETRPSMKGRKDHEKWLILNVWPKYWHTLEASDAPHKKGTKKPWCLENVTNPFREQFSSATPRKVIHDALYRWCTNRAHKTHKGKKKIPVNPTQPHVNPASSVPTAPATNTEVTGAVADDATTSTTTSVPSQTQSQGPGTGLIGKDRDIISTSQAKPRAVTARRLYYEKFKDDVMKTDDIKTKVKARAPGARGGTYLAAWHAVVSEMYTQLSEDGKKVFEEEAETIIKDRMFKPPEDHIADNQELLEAFVYARLVAIIGDNWNQCGDVSFIVHAIKPSKDSSVDIEMITVTRDKQSPFKVALQDKPQYHECFMNPLRRWIKHEVNKGIPLV